MEAEEGREREKVKNEGFLKKKPLKLIPKTSSTKQKNIEDRRRRMCLLTTNERMSVSGYNTLSRSAATLCADANRHILIKDI